MSFEQFDYIAEGQMSLFDFLNQEIPVFKIRDKGFRLIEMFAGYGSQALAIDRLGVPYEHYKISEWCIPSVRLYKAAHFPDRVEESNLSKEDAIKELLRYGVSQDGKEPLTEDNLKRKSVEQLNEIIATFKTTNNLGSITNIKGGDLGIVDLHKWIYMMTYSFPCQ